MVFEISAEDGIVRVRHISHRIFLYIGRFLYLIKNKQKNDSIKKKPLYSFNWCL